jgi:hypothetical protein
MYNAHDVIVPHNEPFAFIVLIVSCLPRTPSIAPTSLMPNSNRFPGVGNPQGPAFDVCLGKALAEKICVLLAIARRVAALFFS